MNQKNGFTIIELLVVVAMIGIVALIQVPAMAKTKQRSQAVSCMNNCRQVMLASLAYAHDFNDHIVPTQAYGGPVGIFPPAWVWGWLDWTTSSDNTNTAYLTNPQYAFLAPYLNGVKYVFKCPADNYLSAVQRAAGWTGRCRSISANYWLGGNASGNFGAIYKNCVKLSDIQTPGPRDTWAFAEEHPDSINDPCLIPPESSSQFVDIPGTFHNSAGNFAFCDGHVELHKWMGALRAANLSQVIFTAINFQIISPNDTDLYWLSYHSPRLAGSAGNPY